MAALDEECQTGQNYVHVLLRTRNHSKQWEYTNIDVDMATVLNAWEYVACATAQQVYKYVP